MQPSQPSNLYYDHNAQQRNFNTEFRSKALKDWEFTFQKLLKEESKMTSRLHKIKPHLSHFLRLPTVEFAARKIQEGHRLMIQQSCDAWKVIEYSTLLKAHLLLQGSTRQVTVVASSSLLGLKQQINSCSYINYSNTDPGDLIVAHCSSANLVDFCSTVLSPEAHRLPNIIFASSEAYELLKKWNKPATQNFSNIKARYFGVDVEYLDRSADIDDWIKRSLSMKIGDIAVFCDLDKIKELTSLAHQSKSIPINLLQPNSQSFHQSPNPHLFICQSSIQLVKFISSNPCNIKIIYDYNTNKSVYFDYHKRHYVERASPVDSEELAKRMSLAFDLGALRYSIKNKGGVVGVKQRLGARDLGMAVLRYGKEKVGKVVEALGIDGLKEELARVEQFLNSSGVDYKNLKIDWDTIPEKLFANELFALLPHLSTNPSVYHLYLVLFSYLRSTITKFLERKVKLTEVKGDFEVIQQIFCHFKSFQNLLKEETVKRRKLSDTSADGQNSMTPLIFREQSSFKDQVKNQSDSKQQTINRFKFNMTFIYKWVELYLKLNGDMKLNFTVGDFDSIECFSDPTILIYSKPLRKYVDPHNKHHFTVDKNAILGQILPTLKHIRIIKTVNDKILVSERNQPPKSQVAQEILEFNQVTTTILPLKQITQFQESHNCEILLNSEFQSIIISCNAIQKEKILADFKQLLLKCIASLKNQVVTRKHGQKNLQFTAGGIILDISKPAKLAQSTIIALRNLPFDWTERDVMQLLQDFASVQSVMMRKNRQNPSCRDAIVEFGGLNDSLNVYKAFNGEEIFGNILVVCKPTDIKNPYMRERMRVIVKWYTHKTDKTGEVVFETEEAARRGLAEIKGYANLEESVPTEGVLVLKNLEEWVDEDYIRQLYEPLGPIKSIALKKIALNEKDNSQLLHYHVHQALKSNNYTIGPIVTVNREIGQRQVAIDVILLKDIDTLFNYFNSKRDLIGKARTYVKKDITYTYMASQIMVKLIKEYLDRECKQKKINNQLIQVEINKLDDEIYMTVKASDTALSMLLTNRIESIQRGAQLTPDSEGLCFTQLGTKAVAEIKSKFTCQISINHAAKKISVICNEYNLKAIQNEITQIPHKKMTIEHRLTKGMFDVFLADQEYLNKIKQILEAEILLDSCSLMLSGSVQNLEKASKLIREFGKELNKKLVSMEEKICEICLSAFESIPVKLMVCGHVFCKDCLTGHLDSCLSNFEQFPIKCPSCFDSIAFRDIEFLLEGSNRYGKLKKIALNYLVSKNADKLSFCLTPGCQGVDWITTAMNTCEYCSKSYCLACKKPYHAGMTCWEAAMGAEELFKRFLMTSDARRCPNKKCSAIIQKNGGCNKVLCSMCKMSICWKCMKYFQQQHEAYDHLNDKHGGYFDN